MDGWFKEAFFHATDHVVFGRRMPPLCLRHLLALYAMRSPYVDKGATSQGATDLALAVSVCSCETESDLQSLMSADDSKVAEMMILGAEIGENPEIAGAAQSEFAAYWDDYFESPELADVVHPGGQRPGKWECHWISIVAAALIRGGYSEQRAWWMPVGEALAMKLAIFEVEGRSFEIMSDSKKEEWRRLGWDV